MKNVMAAGRVSRGFALGSVGVIAAAGMSLAVPTAAQAATTVTFATPGVATWAVPANVSAVTIVATGAGGGGGHFTVASGGSGARVTTNLSVVTGQVLNLVVGGGGAGKPAGVKGASGGGSSNVDAGTGHQR